VKVNLILIGNRENPVQWELGEVYSLDAHPEAIQDVLEKHLPESEAWLFWGADFTLPEAEYLLSLLAQGADVWHAGLKLGTGGLPDFLDFVFPTWMLNCDPDPEIEATSWRISLRCCLVRTEVLRQMGGPLTGFSTLDAAALEMGYRYICHGVFVRYVPDLLPTTMPPQVVIPLEDQLRFLLLSVGKNWTYWACLRACLSGTRGLLQVIQGWLRVRHVQVFEKPRVYQRMLNEITSQPVEGTVSVIIPTLNRYPYLRKLLGQLRDQTLKPLEILVVDQTPIEDRDTHLAREFLDLPLRWFHLEQNGQCTARNLALRNARGEYMLFIDDDDEIGSNLIELHLKNLCQHHVRVSNGVANEVGIADLPENFRFLRISDVFPTGNTLVHRDILAASGLFDLAYDHGEREDGDLGMRIYLSGEMMVLNPEISVLHHHAPIGGLRHHNARVHTYSASRKSIFLRLLPSVSGIYLARRYSSPRRVREMLWIAVLSTFSIQGPIWKRVAKFAISLVALPSTILQLHHRCIEADSLLLRFPQIPAMPETQD
jgi:glycosyltransferase involved in cell wall biosynthesis